MSRKIFVGGLSWSTEEDTLYRSFSRFGTIQSLKVVADQKSGRSRGYAFITYEQEMAAHVAMSQMDGCQIDGRAISVNQAFERCDQDEVNGNVRNAGESENRLFKRPQTFGHASQKNIELRKVFVGGIESTTTENMLHDTFEPFGIVEDIKLVIDKATGKSKGFGFITFRDPESADGAIAEMDGATLGGRLLRVNRAVQRNKKKQGGGGSGKRRLNQEPENP